ncbi:MAG: hypothetical protein G01um101413_550 [Parcubacteria group bacterium Gr01-1014_13]|nr:MAG: hypothetical protein G01um101413_550 [Parcubacteria group bacterium Gr01-1014_13]
MLLAVTTVVDSPVAGAATLTTQIAVAEPGILAEADGARGGLRIELPQVDTPFGDVFHDVVEVVVLDVFNELEGMVGDPAEATVDLEVAFGVGGRDHRILQHLEILPVKVWFLAKMAGADNITKTRFCQYITIIYLYEILLY